MNFKMRKPGLVSNVALRRYRAARLALALSSALALAACGMSETLQRGYVLPEGALEQIPVGASQEQVLIVLGTPSTVATVNGEAFYYISQKTERAAAFMPHEVVDQRVSRSISTKSAASSGWRITGLETAGCSTS